MYLELWILVVLKSDGLSERMSVLNKIGRLFSDKEGITFLPVENYDAGVKAIGNGEYSNHLITDYVVESSKKYLEMIRSRKRTSEELKKWEFDLYSLFQSFYVGKKQLKVLDLGGGLVPLSWLLSKWDPTMALKWGVCELEDLVSKSGTFQNDTVSFHSDFEKCKSALGGIDVFYCRCTLQYCREPLNLLSDVLKVKPQHILFKKLGVSKSGKSAVFLQESNLLDHAPVVLDDYQDQRVSYPVSYVRIEDYVSLLGDEGYQVDYYYDNEDDNEQGAMVTLLATLVD